MSQHYIPEFYLRMFSINPKDRQSRQKVFCLNKHKEISKEKIDDICTFDGYNTEEQEEALSKLVKCQRLFRPKFSKVKTSFAVEIREVSNTLTPSEGVFGDTPV